MNKYFIDHISISENTKLEQVFPNNSTSEYVPFYSILYFGKYLEYTNVIVKYSLPNRDLKIQNRFLGNVISYGLDRVIERKISNDPKIINILIDTCIENLKNYLKEPPNLTYNIYSTVTKSVFQNVIIEKLLSNKFDKSSSGYSAPLFFSTLDNVVLFTPVIKRTNVLKAKLEFIKTGVWNLDYFEFWISKSWLNNNLTKIDSWVQTFVQETNIDARIVDNFKSIYSPEYKEFSTLKERKEFLLKLEDEIKQNVEEECVKMFSIDVKAQNKDIKEIKSKGLYLIDNTKVQKSEFTEEQKHEMLHTELSKEEYYATIDEEVRNDRPF